MKAIGLISLCVLMSACSTPQLFPPEIMRNVETDSFDFTAWKDQQYHPSSSGNIPHHVELGGRILQVDRTAEGVIILAEQLPIVEHPAYGPRTVRREGSFEFAITLRGVPESSMLQVGNRFIVVGTTEGVRSGTVDDIPPTVPFLAAQCIHFWRTQGREIADFPFEMGGSYYTLEEKTYCVKQESEPPPIVSTRSSSWTGPNLGLSTG